MQSLYVKMASSSGVDIFGAAVALFPGWSLGSPYVTGLRKSSSSSTQNPVQVQK